MYKQTAKASTVQLQTAKRQDALRIKNRLREGSVKNKQLWSLLKRTGGQGRNSSVPTIQDPAGGECVTSSEKAGCFGKFFASKNSLGDHDLALDELPALEPRCLAPLSAVHFRPLTVECHLQQLDCSKATGPDAIPARVLKACARSLSHPLSRLFSLCFRKQVQPSLWKVANVTPVHKKTVPNDSQELPPCFPPLHYLQGYGKDRKSLHHQSP